MFVVARSKAVRYGIAHVALLSVARGTRDRHARQPGRGGRCRRGLGRPEGAAGRLAAAPALLAAGPSLLRTVCFDRALGGRDTRLDVVDFLRARGLPPEEVVAVGKDGLPRPTFLGKRKHLAGPPLYIDYLFKVHMARPEQRLTREEGRALRPTFLLRDHTLSIFDVFGWDDFAEVVESEYRVALEVDGRTDPAAVPLPDVVAGTPSFLLPFDNPWAMTRPGPPLTLYERIDAAR